MTYSKTYSPCDDCSHSFSKNNQESNVCKICEFKQALDLINRQKEEIERFEECASREMLYEKVKSDTVNEFAEKFLKKVHDKHYLLSNQINSKDYGMFTVGIEQAVNETKEEMAGEG